MDLTSPRLEGERWVVPERLIYKNLAAGYDLQIDEDKTENLTKAILKYINAGMFYKIDSTINNSKILNPAFS